MSRTNYFRAYLKSNKDHIKFRSILGYEYEQIKQSKVAEKIKQDLKAQTILNFVYAKKD